MQAEKQPAVIFSQRLRLLSRQNNCTQIDLAADFGVSQAAVSKWFNGGMPSHSILMKMALKFGVSTGYLLGIDVEHSAGILPPQSTSPPPKSGAENARSKNITISEMGVEKGIDREELRRAIDEMKRLVGDLERIYKRK